MTTTEIILWSIIGGLIVAILSMVTVVYNKEEPNMKHMGRDFILGAATTGFLYPLIPETFDDLKFVLGSVDKFNGWCWNIRSRCQSWPG